VQLWLGLLLALVLFSPVIAYNLMLFETAGHFDFQLSYVLGQEVQAWPVRTGRAMLGELDDKLRYFLPSIGASFSWPTLALTACAMGSFAISLVRNPRDALRRHGFLATWISTLLLVLLATGPSYRFVTLLAGSFVLASALVIDRAMGLRGRSALVLVVVFLAAEAAYAANSLLATVPWGPPGLSYAKGPYSETRRWGYNDIDDYLRAEFDGRRPQRVSSREFVFLERLRDEARKEQERLGLEPYSAAVVYDGSLASQPRMWAINRWTIFHAWVLLDARDHLANMRALQTPDPTATGFETYYFIIPTDKLPLQGSGVSKAGKRLERELVDRKAEPERLFNAEGEEIARVYKLPGT
jgi:hypothetical protein